MEEKITLALQKVTPLNVTTDNSKLEWVYCPICKNKTRTMVRGDTILEHFPLHCPKCGSTCLIDVKDYQINVINQSP